MTKKNIISASDDIILNLKILAREKESVRRKLAVTATKLAITAEKLAVTAKEKESVRRKLVITAREKESVRRKLVITAEKLAATAEQLAATAKEKESVRRKLAITAAKLAVTAAKLAVTAEKLAMTAEKLAVVAEEKESVRRKLAVTAQKLAVTAEEKESVRRKLVITAAKLAATAEERESVRRKLAITAKEKEGVRRKLAITAKKLEGSYETLENKVFERTKSLEMARAKEEAILLSIGDGLIATDEKGKIILINKTAEKLLEKKGADVMGKIFSKIIFLEDEKGVFIPPEKDPISVALRTNATVAIDTANPVYYARENKTKFPLAIMVTPVILNEKIIGTIKVLRDITNERQIDRAKTEFVSLASHQLRTPLSTVNWYAEMLLTGDIGNLNEKQSKYLKEVYRSNQRMVDLVNALLDVSRLELGTFTVEPELTNIIALAQNVIDEQKPQIDIKKITFSFLAKKVLLITVDPRLLRMVVQNILSNAIKYTPVGGKIESSISLVDEKNVLLKISDTGYGIPKNQHGKIFTKLFRADNVRNKDTDGTGLGLYIVKSIVENSGGKIWFESPKENMGTTFYVSLPIDGVAKN